MRIEVSREEVLLDTGGGLKKAAHFFLENSGVSSEPFLLHNVDVVSTIDLQRMVQFHKEMKALATLAVQQRRRRDICSSTNGFSSADANPDAIRKLNSSSLRSRRSRWRFPASTLFLPACFAMMTEEGVFSIITPICVSPPREKESSPFAPMNIIGATWARLKKTRCSPASHDI
jgi:NDP-sugar pyrophosphorylase family protein